MLFSTFYLVEERTLKLGIFQYGKDVSKMYYVVRKHEKKSMSNMESNFILPVRKLQIRNFQ